MRRPKFSREEQYFVDWAKSSTGGQSSDVWAYLLPTALIAAFAVLFQSIPMLVCAFIVICVFRVREEFAQRKWAPIWTSIINKYEEALAGCDSTPEPEGEG